MALLAIDFAQRRRAASLLGMCLLVAGAVAAGAAVVDWLDAREVLARAETRQARGERLQRSEAAAPRRESPASAARSDAPALDRVAAQLQLPWDALLREVERHADPSVALLAIESQGQARTLRLSGEARSMADVATYVGHLRESPLLGSAVLSGHEERQAGALRVVRFSVDIRWSAPS